jgi:hypothetical protein
MHLVALDCFACGKTQVASTDVIPAQGQQPIRNPRNGNNENTLTT